MPRRASRCGSGWLRSWAGPSIFTGRSPDTGYFEARIALLIGLSKRQIVVATSKGQSKPRLTAPKRKTRRVCPDQRIPLPSLFAASEPERASCRHRWGPQPGDQRQDVGKRLPGDCDFGHLERDVAAVANDLRADLDQLLAQAGSATTTPPLWGSPACA